MGISNKKLNYIKRFAATKSIMELSRDTGLSIGQVERVLKQCGFASQKGAQPLSSDSAGDRSADTVSGGQEMSFFRSAFLVCLAVAFFITPLFFIPGLYDMYSLPKMALLAVLAPLATIFFLLETMTSGRVTVCRCFRFPLLPILLFVGWMALSLFWGVNKYTGICQLTIWGSALLFCIVPLLMYRSIENIRLMSLVITLAAGCVAVMGISQFFGFNFDVIYQAAVPGSFFGNKNFAAQFIVGALPFSVYTAYVFRKQIIGVCASVVFFLLMFFLVISRTRGAWVASTTALFIASAVLVIYLWNNREQFTIAKNNISQNLLRFVAPGLICFIILLGSVYLPTLFLGDAGKKSSSVKLDLREELKSITETKKGSASWRLTAWRNTLLMIKSKPLFGVGLGNWQFYYPIYARKGRVDSDFNEERQAKRTHNDYLQFTAELGIVGIVLLLWFLGNMLYLASRIAFKGGNVESSLFAIAGGASILAIMGNAMFSFPLQEGLPPFFLLSVASMLVFVYSAQKERETRSFEKIPLWGIIALCVAVAWFLFTSVWGYRMCKADYFFLEGKRFNKADMFERSLRPLRQSIKLNPYNFRVYSLLGRSLNELNYYQESVEVNRSALKLHPYYINCMNNLGNALRGIHYIDEAIAVYKEALELFPDFAEAHNNLGIGYKEKGDNEAAKREYLKAIEIDPKYEKAYNNLGNICLAEDRIDEAVHYYKKAIELNPKLSDIYNNVGLAMLNKGEYEEAIKYFDTCIQLNSRLPDPHNNKGTALKKMGETKEAIVQFKKAIAVNSAYLPAYNNLADIALREDRIQDAIDEYERMLHINSNLRSIYQRLGDLNLKLYQQTKAVEYVDKAIDAIERGIALYPKSSALYTILGKIYIESGQNEQALETFQHIVELEPTKPESYFNLGIAYHKSGEYTQAIAAYQRALRLKPDYIFLYFELAKLYEHLGETELAIKNYSMFLEKWEGEEQYTHMAEQKMMKLKEKSSQ